MSKKTILIVEDDTDIREALVDVIEYAGYLVSVAANGKIALDLLKSREAEGTTLPNLILLDSMMPVMDGKGFLDAIAQEGSKKLSHVPVVVFTAGSATEIKRFTSVVCTLGKPIDIDGLLGTIERYC